MHEKKYLRRNTHITELADKIIDLLLYTRKTTATERGNFGLRERMLFCLYRSPLPPRELMEILGMAKSNLALLAAKCERDGLIEKRRKQNDGRAIAYYLTPKGETELIDRLSEIEKKFEKVITDEKERAEAAESLDKAAELLSYL